MKEETKEALAHTLLTLHVCKRVYTVACMPTYIASWLDLLKIQHIMGIRGFILD